MNTRTHYINLLGHTAKSCQISNKGCLGRVLCCFVVIKEAQNTDFSADGDFKTAAPQPHHTHDVVNHNNNNNNRMMTWWEDGCTLMSHLWLFCAYSHSLSKWNSGFVTWISNIEHNYKYNMWKNILFVGAQYIKTCQEHDYFTGVSQTGHNKRLGSSAFYSNWTTAST